MYMFSSTSHQIGASVIPSAASIPTPFIPAWVPTARHHSTIVPGAARPVQRVAPCPVLFLFRRLASLWEPGGAITGEQTNISMRDLIYTTHLFVQKKLYRENA